MLLHEITVLSGPVPVLLSNLYLRQQNTNEDGWVLNLDMLYLTNSIVQSSKDCLYLQESYVKGAARLRPLLCTSGGLGSGGVKLR